jgi:hypothetical protein
MATPISPEAELGPGCTQSETRSVSTCSPGSPGESHSWNVASPMGDYYREADPILLCKAICLVYARWIEQGRKPGSDRVVNSTRRYRPQLVSEIEAEWCQLADVDPLDDLFPYHESYVIRKWIDFRKASDPTKTAWIAASKSES